MVCFFSSLHLVRILIFPRNRAIKAKGRSKKATLRVTSENFLCCVCVACTQIAQEPGTNKEKPPKYSRKQERAKIRGQSADHVGAVTVTPPCGHVPNNSLGTRKQLLRNSYYRVTLSRYISHACIAAGCAFGVL